MATLGSMRILIPDIWVNRAYIHDLAASLRLLGHEVVVDSRAFWKGPVEHDILLWLWPEGFFRHSLGGKLRLLTEHLKQDFFAQLQQWRKKGPVVGILHNWMPRYRKSTAGRHWIDLYHSLIRESHGIIHLGATSLEQWEKRYELTENVPQTLLVSHGLNEQLKLYQERHSIVPSSHKNRPRIFVPGDLRTTNEVDMVLNCMKKLSSADVEWIVVGGETFARRKQQNYWRLKKINQKKNSRCFQRRINDFELLAEMLAADIVVSPRMRGLNSGIPFLAATFDKKVLMPQTGNLITQSTEVDGILFKPSVDGSDLSARLSSLLENPQHRDVSVQVPSWDKIGRAMASFMKTISDAC